MKTIGPFFEFVLDHFMSEEEIDAIYLELKIVQDNLE